MTQEYIDGREDGFDVCRNLVIKCLEKNKNLSVEEIIEKIKSKSFEYGEF